jgi:hypothetical protein
MYERTELQVLKTRVLEPRRFIQVIMGPRQVGKTTLARQLIDQLDVSCAFHSADAVAAVNGSWLEQVWEAARLKIRSEKPKSFLLVIDEIQKVPDWSEWVKKLWDEDTRNHLPLKLVLLGSSRLLVQKGLSESLTGRFESIYMTHWSLKEMQVAFGWDAETYAWFGGYPGSAGLIDDEMRWKQYIRDAIVETSISRDVLQLSRIDKPALLKNLFELGCDYSGQILSFTKVMGQLQDAGNTTTLSHYLALLHTAGLLGPVEKYSGSEARKRAGSPKFQVHNNALFSARRLRTMADVRHDLAEWGRVVESAIGAWLVNESMRSKRFSVYYWRDRGDEVDFVLEAGQQTIAIEVKSGASGNKKGMNAFRKRFNPGRVYLIAQNGIPWQEFLKLDPMELFTVEDNDHIVRSLE